MMAAVRELLFGGKTILTIAPHADDEVLGAGGLLHAVSLLSTSIHILYTTVSGYTPHRGGQSVSTGQRLNEVAAVAEMLGVASYDILFTGEDNHLRLDDRPVHDILSWVESESSNSFAEVDPDIVLIPSGKHNHQDHRAVHEACMGLARARVGSKPRMFMIYEIPATCCPGAEPFDPKIYLPLTEAEVSAKVNLFSLYGSQVNQAPGLRSPEAIRRLARYRGLQCGAEFAEAYELAYFCM